MVSYRNMGTPFDLDKLSALDYMRLVEINNKLSDISSQRLKRRRR